MKFLLNIGLDVNATRILATAACVQILESNGFIVGARRVVESDTEPTLVVEVDDHYWFSPMRAREIVAAIRQTAVDLGQDCIAVWRQEKQLGALIGPRCERWGKFDPQYFFTLAGRRLSDELAQTSQCHTTTTESSHA